MEKQHSFCLKCKKITYQKILASHTKSIENFPFGPEGDSYHSGEQNYLIIECMGCEFVSFKEVNKNYNYHSQDPFGEASITERYFFSGKSDALLLREPKRFSLPNEMNILYDEIIQCYNNGLNISCAACLRAAVEAMCKHFNSEKPPNSLYSKIKDLFERGLLSRETAEALHTHRFMGNYAIHDLGIPQREELEIAIDILEHAIGELFILPQNHKNLSALLTKRSG